MNDNVVNQFHLYWNDFDSSSDGQNGGRLYLNGVRERNDDVDSLLKEGLKSEVAFREGWGPKLWPTRGDRKELHVHGSDFARLFFSAANRFFDGLKDTEGNPLSFYVPDVPVKGPINAIDTPVKDRLAAFEALVRKYGLPTLVQQKVVLVAPQLGKAWAEKVASQLSDAMGNDFPIVAVVGSDKPDLDSRVHHVFILSEDVRYAAAIEIPCALAFYFKEDVPDDTLMQECVKGTKTRLWRFSREETLVRTLRAYVESLVVAPALVEAASACEKNRLSVIPRNEWSVLFSVTRLFPFAFATVPTRPLVDSHVELYTKAVNLDVGPTLTLDGQTLEVFHEEDGSCRYSTIFHDLKSVLVKLSCAVDDVELFCVETRGGTCEVIPYDNSGIYPVNHNQAHSLEISWLGNSDTEIGYSYRVSEGTEGPLFVFARNRFQTSGVLTEDAENWTWGVKGDNVLKCTENRGKNGRRLDVVAEHYGTADIEISMPPSDGLELDRSLLNVFVHIDVVEVAKRFYCKIEPGPRSKDSVRIEHVSEDSIAVYCFPGDEIRVSAWVEGDSTELWNSYVSAEGILKDRWCDKNKVHTLRFDCTGTRKFLIKPGEKGIGRQKWVECEVRPNHSNTVRKLMIALVSLAGLHSYLIYGLNLWCWIVYLAPIVLYVVYKKKGWPLYARLIKVLMLADAFLLLRAIFQEMS